MIGVPPALAAAVGGGDDPIPTVRPRVSPERC